MESNTLTPALPVMDSHLRQILWTSYRPNMPQLKRSEFPNDFYFGTASSAYQYEGAWDKDGKGLSIWDTFTDRSQDRIQKEPKPNILDYSDGKVAVDFYHRYKEDIKLIKDIGLNAFRFSISWARVLPDGKNVNPEGVKFYKSLIKELRRNGIEPFVTLFHFDVPQALEDAYGGFLDKCRHRIVRDFRHYADVCFESFGDDVKHWITLNEPWSFSFGGYGTGSLAPGRRSPKMDPNVLIKTIEPVRFFPWDLCNVDGNPATAWDRCNVDVHGNSATEPYQVAHNLLLAHASAVELYKQKYQGCQKGTIGITNVSLWTVPFSNAIQEKRNDREAACRYRDFVLGWFLEPLTKGDYPETMKKYVNERLPKFTKEESELVKGSFDFLGLNYYTSYYAIDASNDKFEPSVLTDPHVIVKHERDGVPIGGRGGTNWLYIYPNGIKEVLVEVKNKYLKKYADRPIYITENGVAEENKFEYPPKNIHLDVQRINYYHKHLKCIKEAIKEKRVNVKGYFAWSFLDNFEWDQGYTHRFGMYYIDYTRDWKRKPKCSVVWFKKFLKSKGGGPPSHLDRDANFLESERGSSPSHHDDDDDDSYFEEYVD